MNEASFLLRDGYSESFIGCIECDRLIAELERLEQHHVIAVHRLDDRIEKSAREEYIHLKSAVHKARAECELAISEIERHKRVHVKVKGAGSP
jgi:hypothetical protein